jgi:hypothetical protein
MALIKKEVWLETTPPVNESELPTCKTYIRWKFAGITIVLKVKTFSGQPDLLKTFFYPSDF